MKRIIPKGRLVIIGGAEDRNDNNLPEIIEKQSDFTRYDVLKQLLPNFRHKEITVLSIGSSLPIRSVKLYRKVFRKIGFHATKFVMIKDKGEAKKIKFINRIQKTDVVYLSGGDQLKFSTVLAASPVMDELLRRYYDDKNFILGGTSAGAMAMSNIMIADGDVNEGLLKSELQIYSGFGLLDNAIVDTHFIKRGRFGRLAQGVITNPGQLGIGLGEDSALVITKGQLCTTWGSGTVVIIDGWEIGQTNIADAKEDCPVYAERLIVHFLTRGCRFDLKRRVLSKPPIGHRQSK